MKTFRQALQQSEFTITAELSSRQVISVDETLRQAEILAAHVDGIHLAHHRLQASPLALSRLLISEGIDPIPGLSCRDRNRIALQSDLLGLRAIGVTSLILDEDNPIITEAESPAKPVFDVSCEELVAIAHAMNEEDWADGDHEFVIGTRATAVSREPGRNVELLQALAKAGARLLLIQPGPDVELLRQSIQQLVEARLTWKYSVIVSLEQEDADICSDLIKEVSLIPGVSGVNLLTLGQPMVVKAAIRKSGLRA